jgi:uncharacterized protein YndB with AHSA1/START domain
MAERVRGPLVIADLGGYTGFLTGSELDHAHDILADLLGVVADGMRSAIPIAKLEGDAVFCADATGTVSADVVLSAIESCYASFARRRRTIERLTTCTCAACEAIPRLAMKFVAHQGEFVARDIAGSRELVGADVIRVHRLLKNSIVEQTGVSAYAFLSDSLLAVMGAPSDGVGPRHVESYEDCGTIEGRVVDLDRRWREREASADIVVSPEASVLSLAVTTSASPALMWELMTDPRHQRAWKLTATSISDQHRAASRDVGTQTHCVHGRRVIRQEIIDYKPPRHFTYDEQNPIGRMRWTAAIKPTDEVRTEVTLSGELLEGALQRFKHMLLGRVMKREIGPSFRALLAYGDRSAVESDYRREPATTALPK